MNDDLISRQAAIDALIDALAWTWSGTWSEKAAIDAIKNLSSVDAVEVVRCKDCRWKLWTHCSRFEYLPVTDEDYCSKAERRTNA